MTTATAIVLFGHGSRDAQWHAPIQAVADRICAHTPERAVACAYLELTQPTLPEIATQLIADGADKIRIFPMFLGIGKHARDDLPLIVKSLRVQYPKVEFEILAAVGEHEIVLDLLAEIALGHD